MKRLHPPKDFSGAVLIVCLVILSFVMTVVVMFGKQYVSMLQQLEYAHGYKIDLPEELTTVGSRPVDAEIFITDSTIHIQFK